MTTQFRIRTEIMILRLLNCYVLLFALHFTANCSDAQTAQANDSGPERSRFTLGQSFQGKPIECIVHGQGEDVLLVIATIHGTEPAGTPLVESFDKWLIDHPEQLEGRQVVIVPVANPDGMAAGERFNTRGVDLNRNFPAGNWEETSRNMHGDAPLSEPESRILMQVVCRFFPNRVVSIHQPLECVDYDGPGKGLAEAMAAECPLPVKKLGGRPGSFGSFVGETLGKPIITLELPKDAGMDADQLWQTYGKALIAALQFNEPAASAK